MINTNFEQWSEYALCWLASCVEISVNYFELGRSIITVGNAEHESYNELWASDMIEIYFVYNIDKKYWLLHKKSTCNLLVCWNLWLYTKSILQQTFQIWPFLQMQIHSLGWEQQIKQACSSKLMDFIVA